MIAYFLKYLRCCTVWKYKHILLLKFYVLWLFCTLTTLQNLQFVFFKKWQFLGILNSRLIYGKNCEANNLKFLHCVSNTFDCIVTILQWRNAMQWGLFHAQMPIRIFWGGLQSFSVWGGIISFVRWHYFSAWKADFSLKSDVQKKVNW